MADDPNKKHEDGWFVSSQPHEYEYFKNAMKSSYRNKTEAEVVQAILECRRAIAPSEGREKLKACVSKKLS